MAKSGTPKDRAALEARRARLEATLGADKNWQALRLCHAQGDDDSGEERHARDARLELLLLANPTFRAWKQVDDAIEALDKTEADVDPQPPRGLGLSLPPLPLTSSSSPKEVVSLADLSQGIAKLILRASPGGDRASTPASASGAAETAASHPAQAASAPEPVAAEEPAQVEPEVPVEEAAAGAGPEAAVEIVTEAEPDARVGAADEADTEPEEAEPPAVETEAEVEIVAAAEPETARVRLWPRRRLWPSPTSNP